MSSDNLPTLAPPTFPCADCGKIWKEEALRRHQCYRDREGAAHCASKPDCRGRQLSTKHGWDKRTWSRTAREYWYDQLDIRPEDWEKTGWTPKYTEVQRVEAAIHYLSLCWPACMPYACVLNGDESDVRYDENEEDGIKPARERDIVLMLKMAQQSVNRAIHALVARDKVRIDENGRFCPNPAPAKLTILERQALNAIPTVEPEDEVRVKFLRGVPKHQRAKVAAILAVLDEGPTDEEEEQGATAEAFAAGLSQIRDMINSSCGSFRKRLNDLRSARNLAIDEACTEVAIISPRILQILNGTYGRVSPPGPIPSPEAFPAQEDAQASVPNQQQHAELDIAPYSEADVASAFAEIGNWQEHYSKIRFGASPISIGVAEDRKFMRGLLLRLRGSRPGEASDLRLFLAWAFVQIFPDPGSLGKAEPKAKSIGMLYPLAERFHELRPATYGQPEREAAEAQDRRRRETEERERVLTAEEEEFNGAERTFLSMSAEKQQELLRLARVRMKADPRWQRIPPDVREREAHTWVINRIRRERVQGAGRGGD